MLQFSMKIILISIAMALIFSSNAYARHHNHKYNPLPTESYLVTDVDGNILNEQNSDMVRPIASISKLMTVLLASEQDLDEELDIPKKREVKSKIPTRVKTLTRKELITLALVKSDNLAAQILCTNIPDCVDKMNAKAEEIGMINTHYVEPTGLSEENVSTAQDLLKLIMVASLNPVITENSKLPNVEIPLTHGKIKVNNTNPLTSTLDVIVSKTGFTRPAGGCLAMMIDSTNGKRVLILLGSRNAHTRIPEMKKLVAQL